MAPFYVMQLFAAAERQRAAGRHVINLAVGQPGTGAPAAVLDAAGAVLRSGSLGYTDALGVPALREAIAAHTRSWYGVDCQSANVVVTTGSSGAFLLAFLAAFDVSDVVALARPGYPAYRNILASLGCQVHEFECGPDQGFHLTAASLDALPGNTRGLVLASPANPTGAMASVDQVQMIAGWCQDHGVRLISDEIYHGITYTQRAASAWQFSQESIVINSFSKYFCMTGWRLGWVLVPDRLLDAVARLAANLTICPPAISQYAALAAFQSYPELDGNVARYAANRDLLLTGLAGIGLPVIAPADGAFYLYADVSAYTDNSLRWVHEVLQQTGVALAPGLDFDVVNGHSSIRLSFAGPQSDVRAAIEVLGEYLSR